MSGKAYRWLAAATFVLALGTPGVTWAQGGNSGIAGIVKDTSGAVLPGVSVEAASPALIEKVRTVVTDSEGSYKILDVRPGVYTVTFSLPGFSTVKRTGIELPASFTATVNADMAVGSVEETVTVTGAAPLVDVQNVTSQRVMSRDLLESIPAARSPQGFAALQPGIITQGIGGIPGGREEMNTSVHGAPTVESVFLIDGINTAEAQGAGGSGTVFRISQAYVSEINIVVGGGTAEQPFGGTVTNIIPKEGGNQISGSVYGEFSGDSLATSNLNASLVAQGFTDNSLSNLVKLWDFQPAIGGRIVKDKLWFFTSAKQGGSKQTRAGLFENLTPTGFVYTPDLTHPAINKLTDQSINTRLTYQVNQKNKVSVFGDIQPHIVWNRGYQFSIPSEATAYTPYYPNAIFMGQWKSPLTSKMLVEASVAHDAVDYDQRRQTPDTCGCESLTSPLGYDVIAALETSTTTLLRANSGIGPGGQDYGSNRNQSWRYAASSSYITGSHAVKVGWTMWNGFELFGREPNGDVAYRLRNGAPISLVQYASNIRWRNNVYNDTGLYVQDQWTMKKLTLTGGVRYDYYNAGAEAAHLAAGIYTGARDFPQTKKSPLWKDVSPRVAASYDIFGDGKTALKFSLGRFVAAGGAGSGGINASNPVVRSVLSVTRNWTDANGNFNPDCDLKNPLANGECAQISDLNFGQNNPKATVYDQELLSGLRQYNWETTVVLQRQVAKGISVTMGYFRRNFTNFTVTDNTLVAPTDYSQYCITAPTDSRLPNGGGYQICGLYDVNPALFGVNQNIVKDASHFGKQLQTYDGIDLTESARLPGGMNVQGGFNWGRTKTNTCFVVDSPSGPPVPGLPATGIYPASYCNVAPPMQMNATFVGFAPLPWFGLITSATYRDYPGTQYLATYQATNAQIAPSLGRNLSSGANGTVNVELIKPGTMYGPRQRQIDFRISKRMRFGARRISGNFDIFNVLNATGINTVNATFGSQWLRPTQLQQGRYLKLSAQFDF